MEELKKRTLRDENITKNSQGYYCYVNHADKLMTTGFREKSDLLKHPSIFRFDIGTVRIMADRYSCEYEVPESDKLMRKRYVEVEDTIVATRVTGYWVVAGSDEEARKKALNPDNRSYSKERILSDTVEQMTNAQLFTYQSGYVSHLVDNCPSEKVVIPMDGEE